MAEAIRHALVEIQNSERRALTAQKMYRVALEHKVAVLQRLQLDVVLALRSDDAAYLDVVEAETTAALGFDPYLAAARDTMLFTAREAADKRSNLDTISKLVDDHEHDVLAASFAQLDNLLDAIDLLNVTLPNNLRHTIERTMRAMALVAANGFSSEVIDFVLKANPFDQIQDLFLGGSHLLKNGRPSGAASRDARPF